MGCEAALRLLLVYVDLVRDGTSRRGGSAFLGLPSTFGRLVLALRTLRGCFELVVWGSPTRPKWTSALTGSDRGVLLEPTVPESGQVSTDAGQAVLDRALGTAP